MKDLLVLTTLLLALTACATSTTPTPHDEEMTATQGGLPNPASVHCRETGNTLEIQTADDGTQHGVCVFPDGSTCDEWAYFRGECDPAGTQDPTPAPTLEVTTEPGSDLPPGATEEVTDWWGVILKTDAGAQFDDYFERQDLGQSIIFGIDSRDPAVEVQIEALRDTGTIVHLYGTLYSNEPDVNGSQILIDRVVVDK